ncbi:MAG: DUF6712 family protein [Bacteroidales bacterium]
MVINTTEIKKHISVNADFDEKVLQPHLDWAEESYIPDLLGVDLYNKLLAYIDSNTSVDVGKRPHYEKLKSKIIRVIVHIAAFDWMSVAGVSITDIGLQRIEGEMQGLTKKSAYQYQELNAKEFFRKKGFNSMDSVLNYIVLNITQFEEFKTSETYENISSDIIPDIKCFEKYYAIGNSMLLFMKLKPYIRESAYFTLCPVIGKELFIRIKNDFNTDNDIKELLPEVRTVLANMAIARGIEATSINFLDDGARLIVKDSTNGNFEKTNRPDLTAVIAAAAKTADEYLGLLCQNISANLDKYPEYVDARITPIDNTDRKFVSFY